MRRYGTVWIILVDLLSAAFAWSTFYFLRATWLEHKAFDFNPTFYLGVSLVPLAYLLLYYLQGTYLNVRRLYRLKIIQLTLIASIMGSLMLFFVLLLDDEVINYKDVDFSKWAVEKYGKPQRRNYEGGVDVVINFTGGDTWVPSLRWLKRRGKSLVCGATARHDPKEDLRYVWSFELQIIGSNSFYMDNLTALMDMISKGEITPMIDKILPLEQASEGLRLIQDREVLGKVIITP